MLKRHGFRQLDFQHFVRYFIFFLDSRVHGDKIRAVELDFRHIDRNRHHSLSLFHALTEPDTYLLKDVSVHLPDKMVLFQYRDKEPR